MSKSKIKTRPTEEPAENLNAGLDGEVGGEVDGERQERQEERPPATADQWLDRAISMATQWETRRRECGEAIAKAMEIEPSLTQQAIADRMRRSLGWVNGMCQWIKRNYQGTPFGEGPHSGPESDGEVYVEAEELMTSEPEDGETGGGRKRRAKAGDELDEDKKLARAIADTIAGCTKLTQQTAEQLAANADSMALLALRASAPKLGELAKAALAILAARLQEESAA